MKNSPQHIERNTLVAATPSSILSVLSLSSISIILVDILLLGLIILS